MVPLVTGGSPPDGGFIAVRLATTSTETITGKAQSGGGSKSEWVTWWGSAESTSVPYLESLITVQAPTGTGWTLVDAFSP